MDNDIREKVMMRVATFPNMPRAAIELRTLFTQKEVSVPEIEKILRHDPGLATNVLRLANSAFFGLRTKVGSLKHAVILLGVKRFAQIAFSESLSKMMDKTVEGYDLSPGALWRHSIGVANTAEFIARYKELPETEDVYTPALIHDMGKLILGKFFKEERSSIESITTSGIPLFTAEEMVLGINHAETGALLMAKWSFPADIVDAVRRHHDPENSEGSNTKSVIVYLCNIICHSDSADCQSDLTISKMLEKVGINEDQFKLIYEKVHDHINKMSEQQA